MKSVRIVTYAANNKDIKIKEIGVRIVDVDGEVYAVLSGVTPHQLDNKSELSKAVEALIVALLIENGFTLEKG